MHSRTQITLILFCCKKETLHPQRQSSLSYTPGVNGCAVGHVCCRSPSFRQSRQVSSCGRRSSFGLLGRVKNTHFEQGDTEFGEYPWQAAILRRDAGDNVYVCGAVLIDNRHLLTAAHCISGYDLGWFQTLFTYPSTMLTFSLFLHICLYTYFLSLFLWVFSVRIAPVCAFLIFSLISWKVF